MKWGKWYYVIGSYILSDREMIDVGMLYDTPIQNLNDIASNAEMKLLSDEISLKVSKDNVVNEINLSSEGAKIKANKITLEGSTTVGDSNSNHIQINNADYSIMNGSKEKCSFGLRTLAGGKETIRMAMGHNGIANTDNYFVTNVYPGIS